MNADRTLLEHEVAAVRSQSKRLLWPGHPPGYDVVFVPAVVLIRVGRDQRSGLRHPSFDPRQHEVVRDPLIRTVDRILGGIQIGTDRNRCVDAHIEVVRGTRSETGAYPRLLEVVAIRKLREQPFLSVRENPPRVPNEVPGIVERIVGSLLGAAPADVSFSTPSQAGCTYVSTIDSTGRRSLQTV